MVARDGTTVLEDPDEYGIEWQVRPEEPMLFQTLREPQYPQVCALPDPTSTQRRLGSGEVSFEDAQKACAHYSSGTSQDACIHDVMAADDLDLAQAGVY